MLVEDDELFHQAVQDYLGDRYEVVVAVSAEEAITALRKKKPDLILMDVTLPGMNGIEALKQVKQLFPDIPVTMLTALEQIPRVVECMKFGAFDYLSKPVIVEELLASIDRALDAVEIRRELDQRRNLQLLSNREYRLIGSSSEMEKVRKEIGIAASADTPVLIEGETGTGKELVARQIHGISLRATCPFVAINCGAIPRDLIEAEFFGHRKGAFTGAATAEIGKFQLAHGGTLLLDEVGELPPPAQTRLLRVLEEKEFYPVGGNELIRVDVRVIASTNRNLEEMVRGQLFREDLYFRLNVFRIIVPPLRKHPDDIEEIAMHFLQMFNAKFGKSFTRIDPTAQNRLFRYPWKGNIRELRNLMERIVLSYDGPNIREDHLRSLSMVMEPARDEMELPEEGLNFEDLEKNLILQALNRANGNKTKAAKLLRMSAPTFYYRLEKYGLH